MEGGESDEIFSPVAAGVLALRTKKDSELARRKEWFTPCKAI